MWLLLVPDGAPGPADLVQFERIGADGGGFGWGVVDGWALVWYALSTVENFLREPMSTVEALVQWTEVVVPVEVDWAIVGLILPGALGISPGPEGLI